MTPQRPSLCRATWQPMGVSGGSLSLLELANSSGGKGCSKAAKVHDPLRPKRPPSGFLLYCSSKRLELKHLRPVAPLPHSHPSPFPQQLLERAPPSPPPSSELSLMADRCL